MIFLDSAGMVQKPSASWKFKGSSYIVRNLPDIGTNDYIAKLHKAAFVLPKFMDEIVPVKETFR